MLRRLALLPLVALAVVARADRTLVYRYEIAGSQVGESRTVVKDDGTFEGSTKVDFGQKFETTFSGKAVGAGIPEWSLAMVTGSQNILMKSGKDAGTFELKGPASSQPLGAIGKIPAKFALFAPYFFRTFRPMVEAGTGKGAFDILVFERLTKDKATLIATSKRDAGNEPVTLATFKVANVEVQVAFDRAGECVGLDVPAQKFRVVAEGFEGTFVSPVDLHPELSRATFTPERTTVQVPVRDAVKLATEIIRPKTDAKVPTILIRTPYGRAAEALANGWYAARGYAVVVQDCRGRGGSDGAWDPFVNESRDGADAIAWIAKQPWSDGKVGMIGGSYGGLVQWAAAVQKPAALKCIVPQVSPPASAMRNLPYVYGVPMLLPNLWWLRIVEKKDADLSFYSQGFPGAKGLTTLPLSKLDNAVFGRNLPVWDSWLRRDSAAKWEGWNFQSKLAGVSIPTLHVSGYFDGDQIGTMLNWETRREGGWTNQWLVYGPWPHGFNASTSYGGVEFGRDSQIDLDSVYLRFFDTYLKGRAVGWGDQPKVSAFLTGANRWLRGDSWPLPESRETSLYLAGSGRERTGELLAAPRKGDRPSRYVYDPRKAKVPAALTGSRLDLEGSLTLNAKDITGEMLAFRSASMKRAMRVVGPITFDATISTSARSTDLFAIVLDEGPGGKFRRIGQSGVLRVGSKNNGDIPGAVVPNRPNLVHVRLWDFAHEFAPGHRMTLLVLSDAFPAYARNLGTAEPIATGTRMIVQRNTIYHDTVRTSRLRFRVLP